MLPGLEVLVQLVNAEIARPNVMTRVRTRDLTIACEFNFSGLSLYLRQKKNHIHMFFHHKTSYHSVFNSPNYSKKETIQIFIFKLNYYYYFKFN
jgi:hypothetical protein